MTFSADDLNRRKIYSHDSSATTFNTFYNTAADNPSVTFVNNESVTFLKVFDKISVTTDEIVSNGIFSIFTFETNIDSANSLDLTTTNIDKVVAGKQIVPIVGQFVEKYYKI